MSEGKDNFGTVSALLGGLCALLLVMFLLAFICFLSRAFQPAPAPVTTPECPTLADERQMIKALFGLDRPQPPPKPRFVPPPPAF